jgi:CheY-like chemotaxis protein
MQLVLAPLVLNSVINNLKEIFEMLLKRKQVSSNKSVAFHVNIPVEINNLHIIADKLRLEQVLSNLINNALKFTKEGYIEIGCARMSEKNMLEFYVKDTGIGIKEENLDLIFERFRKVEDDKTQLYRGTGLGLAISNHLVSLMGGTMSVISKYGEGSVFYFTIPLDILHAPVEQPIINQESKNTIPDLRNVGIVVAEDDISNFNYIKKLLQRTHANVFHAENGKQVLNIFQDHQEIQLILMDIKMPVLDGIETLHALRNMNVQIPIIAQTAYALANDMQRLKNEGFDEYISKPINADKFYRMLVNLLRIK